MTPRDAYDQDTDWSDTAPDEVPLDTILDDIQRQPRLDDVDTLVLIVRRLMVGAARQALDAATEYAQEVAR